MRKESRETQKGSVKKKSTDDLVRLNKYIAVSGVCSRREADQLITAGLISVNGPTTERLDLTNLDKGVYFISLENENEKLLKKVVLK